MVIIIGAGPAGISAAYHLYKAKKDFIILEKEKKIGGLCQSFELGGTYFDLGGHAFFSNDKYLDSLLNKVLSKPLYKQNRSAWVHSFNNYLKYPFQANLYNLPQNIIAECLIGLYDNLVTDEKSPPNNMLEWIYQSFGSGIAKHFMVPYNEKIWAFPLDKIVTNWAGDRIVQPNYKEIITGALQSSNFDNYPNHIVSYPQNGGFEEMFQEFAKSFDMGKYLIYDEAREIDLESKIIKLASGQHLNFDKIISTLPLTHLVNCTKDIPQQYLDAASKLEHFSLYLVNIVINKPNISDKQRVYSADPDVPFHKLVLNSNSSDFLRNKKVFSFQAEVSFSRYKKVNKDKLLEGVFKSLVEIGLVNKEEEPLACNIVELPYAYPIYTSDWKQSRETLFDYYHHNDIFCAGRFGEWLYINSDKAILRGMEAAAKVLDIKTEDLKRIIL